MIDHVSIGVRDLAASTAFYEGVLETIGFAKLVSRAATVGFGKTYAELWLNHRPLRIGGAASGTHICLRARSPQAVDAFHARAVATGAADGGRPGLRPEYDASYYAAFIRDFDDNVIEVVTFVIAAGQASST